VCQRANGTISVLPSGGSLLGTLARIEVVVHDVMVGPGDRIILYTDGVTEARSGDSMFGLDGLIDSIRTAPDGAAPAAQCIETAVLRHSGGVLGDDMAVLVVEPAI
jgi:sigma-B regulation protein RsbU (phosphoserine phosphatase)